MLKNHRANFNSFHYKLCVYCLVYATSNNIYTPPTLLLFKNTNPHLFKIQTQKHMGGASVLYRTFGVYHFISQYFVAEVVFIILQVYFCSIYHFAQND